MANTGLSGTSDRKAGRRRAVAGLSDEASRIVRYLLATVQRHFLAGLEARDSITGLSHAPAQELR